MLIVLKINRCRHPAMNLFFSLPLCRWEIRLSPLSEQKVTRVLFCHFTRAPIETKQKQLFFFSSSSSFWSGSRYYARRDTLEIHNDLLHPVEEEWWKGSSDSLHLLVVGLSVEGGGNGRVWRRWTNQNRRGRSVSAISDRPCANAIRPENTRLQRVSRHPNYVVTTIPPPPFKTWLGNDSR